MHVITANTDPISIVQQLTEQSCTVFIIDSLHAWVDLFPSCSDFFQCLFYIQMKKPLLKWIVRYHIHLLPQMVSNTCEHITTCLLSISRDDNAIAPQVKCTRKSFKTGMLHSSTEWIEANTINSQGGIRYRVAKSSLYVSTEMMAELQMTKKRSDSKRTVGQAALPLFTGSLQVEDEEDDDEDDY